jgi:hypothetical protein
MKSVFLVTHSDYDEYSIEGIFESEADAKAALQFRGFRIYKTGRARGLWSKRGWWYPLKIEEYPIGWRGEDD